jgi:hypothetical protein
MIHLNELRAGEWQLRFGGISVIVYGYEYDAHPDYTWLALDVRGRYPVEIRGEFATEIYLKLAAAGVKGELFKEKTYIYKGGL